MIPIPTRMGHLPSKANPFCVLFGCVSPALVYVYVSHTNESPHASRNKEGTICFDCLIRNTIPLSKISGLPARANSFCVLFGYVSPALVYVTFHTQTQADMLPGTKNAPLVFDCMCSRGRKQRMHHLSLIVCVRVGGCECVCVCVYDT